MNNSRSLKPLWILLGLSVVFFFIIVATSSFLFFKSGGAGPARLMKVTSSEVGVLEVKGVIMDSKRLLRDIESLEEDSAVKAVVVRLDSPGGSVAPSQEVYEALKKLKSKKPVVSSMASVAASGAYYIAMGTDKVFANPGTLTGSIGVIMEFANLEKLYEWAKIRRFSIKTGTFKDAGADYREMTAEERSVLQAMVDDVLSQFKGAVAESRKLSVEQVNAVADGRIFSGAQAKQLGLVDELGTFDQAIEYVANKAGIKGKPSVVYPARERRSRVLEYLFEDTQADESEYGGRSSGLIGSIAKAIAQELRVSSSQAELAPGLYWLWMPGR